MSEKVRVCIELPKNLYEGIVKNPDHLSNGVIYDAIRAGHVMDTSGLECPECGDYLKTFVTPDEVGIRFCPTCDANMVRSYMRRARNERI